MASTQLYIVVTFHTTSQALGFESFAKKQGLAGRLAPVPRQLSAGCGFAWLEPAGSREALVNALPHYDLGHEGVAQLDL
ncbi:MAG: DUF3343 domain-containing protein [Coriobacteriia bacterium]|nr:DUF3343 domain-containing protein [Coriobacteriia bacterium]